MWAVPVAALSQPEVVAAAVAPAQALPERHSPMEAERRSRFLPDDGCHLRKWLQDRKWRSGCWRK
ncbi:unnamed protein product [Effrenium voratum]|uniref:Uncharacterized protein n=1 Tax=Effrenium voratum TaxID=2562239 RepID=A0AA36HW39_9DINO|nr:unnamed protein product [Effrenium voratum]